jgi:tetratricopeptide (TPR) repeat protein
MRRPNALLTSVAVLAVAVVVSALWFPWTPTQTAMSPRNRAKHLLAECQWQATIDACDSLLRESSDSESADSGEVWLWRGRARFALGQFDAALGDFSEAISRLPKDPEPRYFRAMAYEQLGKPDQADADFGVAQRLDPRNDKFRVALKNEEAAREVQGMVRESNRVAEARADKLLVARHAQADARVAALHEDATARRLAKEAETAAKLTARQAISVEANAEASSETLTDPQAAFERLSSEKFFDDRRNAILPQTTEPSDLAKPKPGLASLPVIANPSDLGGDLLGKDLTDTQDMARRIAAADQGRLAAPKADGLVPSTPKDPLATRAASDGVMPLSAWEQFRQQHQNTRAVDARDGQPPSVWPGASTFSRGDQRDERTLGGGSVSQNTASPSNLSGVGPLNRNVSALSNNRAGMWVNGPLAARNNLGQPLSTAQPSPNAPRGPENAFSTATLPLPVPALDKNMAVASGPPGVLSMAMHELNPPSAAKANVPLTTQSAPLPAWITPPTSTTPNRR